VRKERNYISALPQTYKRFITFKGELENRTGVLHSMDDVLNELLDRAGVPEHKDWEPKCKESRRE
jgi:hypothetical protein